MAGGFTDLSIRGESIQRIYGNYRKKLFFVNRKYQRKLVWSVEEKREFIRSILNGYPVPLLLFAEVPYEESNRWEIIDGMQRLNAVMSFIEQQFEVDGKYFDLESLAETKDLMDKKILFQRFPRIDREKCVELGGYELPFSVYKSDNDITIDDVFRRINSGGKQLSKQELRQSGATTHFADIVRIISAKIRGDDSATDRLELNSMNRISVSNKELKYGIDVNNIFWVKENIIIRDKVRQSRDEEIVADTLAYILLSDKPASRAEYIDSYYGITDKKTLLLRHKEIETNILKVAPEKLVQDYIRVFDELRRVLSYTNKPFNQLMFSKASANVPRYFQAVFLALYETIVENGKKVANYERLASKLDGVGQNISAGAGGGTWSAAARKKSVEAVSGVILDCFDDDKRDDPGSQFWTTRFENILTQSFTEQSSFDFKQGFHRLDKHGAFDQKAFSEAIKTLTAIANNGVGRTGYLIVGVADTKKDAEHIASLYNDKFVCFAGHFVSGINGEAIARHATVDKYFEFILSKFMAEPVPETFKEIIGANVRLVRYYDRAVLVFKVDNIASPVVYDNGFCARIGSKTVTIKAENYSDIFKRFHVA